MTNYGTIFTSYLFEKYRILAMPHKHSQVIYGVYIFVVDRNADGSQNSHLFTIFGMAILLIDHPCVQS